MVEMRPTELRVGLVGLGYWGPNLLRVLVDMQGVEVRRICDLDEQRLEHFSRRHPASARPRASTICSQDPELDAVVLATPIHTHYELALQSLEAGKHTFVEKPLARSGEEAQSLIDLADANAPRADVRPDLPVQPAGSRDEAADRGGRARRDLLHLLQPGEPRAPPARRERHLGSRPARLLDPPVLARRVPDAVTAVGRDSVVARHPRRRVRDADVPLGRRSRTSSSAGSRRASCGAPSWSAARRWSCTRTAPPEPIRVFNHGVIYEDPETFGEYHLSYRTGDIVSPKLDSYEPIARELDEFVSAVRAGDSPPGHLELGQRVVMLAEAAQHSLDHDGVRVALAGVV